MAARYGEFQTFPCSGLILQKNKTGEATLFDFTCAWSIVLVCLRLVYLHRHVCSLCLSIFLSINLT
jgi:hypothetical protein